MAEHSLNELMALINQQVTSREELAMLLLQAKALTDVALDDGFLAHSRLTIHRYLSALDDAVEKVRALNEASLNALLKTRPKVNHSYAI